MALALLASACGPQVERYVLFRAEADNRVQIATFDSTTERNRENCHAVQDRLVAATNQRYWCEQAR